MKYHLVLEIPDELVLDNRLSNRVTYMAAEDGFVKSFEDEGALRPLTLDEANITMQSLNITEGDVIVFKYPDDVSPEDACLVKDIIQSEFPNNKVLGLTSNIELMSMYPKEAIEMLEKMIAHIKIVNI